MDDEEIRSVLKRLGRPDRSGGLTVERAAILAEGADFDAVMAFVLAHGGEPETAKAAAPRKGLHGTRLDRAGTTDDATPRRFILPPGALDD